MKRAFILLSVTITAVVNFAQTMNIKTGCITTAIDAKQAGEMLYANSGTELTIMGKTFAVSDIDKIYIDESIVKDNTVSINYSGTTAQVIVAGNIAQYLTTTVDGAYVSIVQDENVTEEITYTLSGSSDDGAFTMDGELKATVVLNGVSLTSKQGAAIDIKNGKRIAINVADGTTNTFADYELGLQKSCFFVNGHAEFTGGGTINVTGNARHGYRSDEYTQLKNTFTGTINVLGAVSDGIHIEQYLEMNNGTVNVNVTSGDAIDVAATTNLADEYNGQVFINGGSITATTDGEDVKVLKSEAAISITDGVLKLTATGDGSKAIGTKGTLNISGGKIEALSLGDIFHEDLNDEAKPNSIKATGIITITGGEVYSVSTNKAFNTDVATNGFIVNGGKVMGIGPKASPAVKGTQGSKSYTGVSISGGQTVTYGAVSYTVPSNYSCAKAVVLVSPSN